MVATVGSISIDLSTNAAKFATGFKSAATTVETQSGRMAKSISALERNTALAAGTLKSLGTGLAAGAGLAALASLGGAFDKLKQTISEYDEIASNAKTTGLRTDTYQALAFAAKQANIEQESYNSALNIFAKNAGLAATGQGALYSGLKKLNPELLQNILNTKDQEERLKLVADAMAQTSDATEKAALSTAVFGKGGVEMSRIFEQGRASIDKFKKTALELGLIVPDDLLQRAGELDDKLDVLSKVIDVQLGQSLINLAPILVGAVQGFADFSKELNATSAIIDNFINNPSLANFGKIFGDGSIKNAIDGLSATTHRSTEAIQADIDEVTQKLQDLKIEAAAGFEVGLATDRAQDELKALQDELRRTGIAAEAAANNAAGAFDSMLNSMGNVAAAGSNPVPTVHRYGGDPNQIELPQSSFNYQSNVNGSGVGVLKASVDKTAGYTEDTAKSTQQTAAAVTRLDANAQKALDGLGYTFEQAMASLSSNVNGSLSILANQIKTPLDQAWAAFKYANAMSTPVMAGAAYDPTTGLGAHPLDTIARNFSSVGERPRYSLDSAHDASSTSVNVQQPGTNITLNYQAAPGESEGTARQRARDMYDELLLQASRA